jgi:caffeoyl-CoA O-methyltransferase
MLAPSLTSGHGTVRTVASRSTILPSEISAYIAAHAAPPDDVLRELQGRTVELGPASRMQVSPEEGALLTLLTRLVGARQAIELGTFTGYSSTCIARGMAEDGHLLCCDVSEEFTAVAKDTWERAGLSDRIELRIGPALDTVRALPATPHLDLAFIDADKANYAAYYDELLPRTRPGGMILVDNTLWSGRVVDQDVDDPDTVAIRAFNDKVAADDRVDAVILPVADGLTLIRKR